MANPQGVEYTGRSGERKQQVPEEMRGEEEARANDYEEKRRDYMNMYRKEKKKPGRRGERGRQ